MRTNPIARTLAVFFFMQVRGLPIFPLPKLAVQQPPHCAQVLFCLFNQETAATTTATKGAKPMSSHSPFLDSLNTLAEEAGTPAGAGRYSRRLVELLAGDQLGDANVSALSKRLATADFTVRNGKRNYVAEVSVASAFNGLMKTVHDKKTKPIETDEVNVHRLRLALSGVAPTLTSVKAHPSSCLPTEAFLLSVLLITNNGSIKPPPAHGASPRLVTRFGPSSETAIAGELVARFFTSHSQSRNLTLLDALFKNLGL